MSDDSAKSSDARSPQQKLPTAKFMNNLLVRPMDRTQYVKVLEKVTVDPRISYTRIISGMAIAALVLIVFVYQLFSSGGKLAYTWPGVVLGFVASLALVLVFVLPSRGRSLLTSTYDLLMFQVAEKLRLKTSVNGELRSIGVDRISRGGLIRFDNGDYGRVYLIEGQLGLSTLPSVVEMVRNARHQYLIARTPTSQEMLVTSVSRLDLTRQLMSYESRLGDLVGSSDVNDHWRSAMLRMQHLYTSEAIHDRDTAVVQYRVVRDVDKGSLRKSETAFMNAVNAGMLSSARPLESRDSVLSALSGVALLAVGGED